MGAVAICIKRSSNRSKVDNSDCIFPPLDGQAFCFLPLPVQTYLPVHVNAYFELSSNRRDIWRADDTTGESKIRGQWNVMLMTDVIAPLYAELLSRAVEFIKAISKSRNPVEKDASSSILSLALCNAVARPMEICEPVLISFIEK
jgi:hypothetical protein